MTAPVESLFSLLPPIAVDDATLTSTNVPEIAAATTYNPATAYALGQIAGVTAGTVQAVYESIQAVNTGHTPVSSPTWWRFVGNAAAEYAGGTTYAQDAVIGTTVGLVQTVYKSLQAGNIGHAQASSPTWWQLLSTVNATYDTTVTYALADIVTYVAADVHLQYKSTGAGNINNVLTDVAKWTLLGSTNARAMFDSTYGSQTTNYDNITFTITPAGLLNSLWFGNMDAANVHIVQPASGFDRTILLNEHDVLNWYDFYYKPLTRRSDAALVAELPPYPASPITITINNAGGTAKCGIFVQSIAYTLGYTQWEPTAGIVSYSGTATDGRGNTTFAPRAKVPKVNVEVRLFKGSEDAAFRIMTDCTDVPLVVVCSTTYRMLQAYGSLGTWALPVSNKGKNMTVEFKGLT